MLGGRLLDHSTNDPQERQLLNIIEEMAIASGVPVPDTYLMDHELGINAFAAGNSINDAVIGVTRGCMEQLDRSELQGVMAHEYSHILNGDMKMNLRLTGWIHGLLCIAIIGRILLHFGGSSRSSSRDGKGGNPLPLIGLALLVIGGIGMLFGRLIKASVSRQREFLADASAVQFTRNPAGISGALKKIGGLHSKLESPKAEEASHLFFGNGLGASFMSAFATHPPLEERIKRIDPKFSGGFSETHSSETAGQSELVSGLAGGPAPAPIDPPLPSTPVAASNVMQQIGQLDAEHINYAHDLLTGLPPVILQSAHETFGAVALSYSLLLSPDKSTRNKQLRALDSNENPAIVMEVGRLSDVTAKLDPRTRIPLVEMSLPALRQLSHGQYATFVKCINALSEADRQIDLFEFSLEKILRRHLDPTFTGETGEVIQFRSIDPLTNDCNVLISALAYISHSETAEVEKAYVAGTTNLPGGRLQQLPIENCGLGDVDRSMDRLAKADPRVKEKVVQACSQTVTADGKIEAGEAEMLRAICAALDIPCPPLL